MSDRNIFRPPVREEVDEELSFHVEMRVRELVASGLTVDEARSRHRAARARASAGVKRRRHPRRRYAVSNVA